MFLNFFQLYNIKDIISPCVFYLVVLFSKQPVCQRKRNYNKTQVVIDSRQDKVFWWFPLSHTIFFCSQPQVSSHQGEELFCMCSSDLSAVQHRGPCRIPETWAAAKDRESGCDLTLKTRPKPCQGIRINGSAVWRAVTFRTPHSCEDRQGIE